MKGLASFASGLTGFLVLILLLVLGLHGNSLLYGIAAILLAVALACLVGFGPEQMGIGLMVLGMLTAPMNALGLAGNVDVSDVFFVVAFGLLMPRMLATGRPRLPPLYVIGAAILFAGGMISSMLAPAVAASIVGFVKIIAATMVLVFVLNLLRPAGKLLDRLAWAYVVGQGISVLYGFARHGATHAQGRGAGLTTQPNFYGLGGQMAYALLIFLFYRVDPKNRWIVVGAMAVVGYSVIDSGSRASLLCCALVTLAWPIVERSAVAWYVFVSGAAIAVIAVNTVLSSLGQVNVLQRLQGNTSAQYSDAARNGLLHQGFTLFLHHPIQGNGWSKDTLLAFHNAYLEVAVGGGILTLFGFVLIMAALIRPLFQPGAPNRLAYAGLSYAAFGLIGPTLYDRIVWAALALILVTYEHNTPEPAPDPIAARLARRQHHRAETDATAVRGPGLPDLG
ncbi:MAG: hypothetical protein JWP74_2968 [Marmoricola sp.]|nr:hypothetical protein [Marmoricola sp.]